MFELHLRRVVVADMCSLYGICTERQALRGETFGAGYALRRLFVRIVVRYSNRGRSESSLRILVVGIEEGLRHYRSRFLRLIHLQECGKFHTYHQAIDTFACPIGSMERGGSNVILSRTSDRGIACERKITQSIVQEDSHAHSPRMFLFFIGLIPSGTEERIEVHADFSRERGVKAILITSFRSIILVIHQSVFGHILPLRVISHVVRKRSGERAFLFIGTKDSVSKFNASQEVHVVKLHTDENRQHDLPNGMIFAEFFAKGIVFCLGDAIGNHVYVVGIREGHIVS